MTGFGTSTPIEVPVPRVPLTGTAGFDDTPMPRGIKGDGTPDTALYSGDDPPERRPRPGMVTTVSVFDLSTEEGVREYENCLNRLGTGRFLTLRHTERRWVEATASWKVLVEICEAVQVAPDNN